MTVTKGVNACQLIVRRHYTSGDIYIIHTTQQHSQFESQTQALLSKSSMQSQEEKSERYFDLFLQSPHGRHARLHRQPRFLAHGIVHTVVLQQFVIIEARPTARWKNHFRRTAFPIADLRRRDEYIDLECILLKSHMHQQRARTALRDNSPEVSNHYKGGRAILTNSCPCTPLSTYTQMYTPDGNYDTRIRQSKTEVAHFYRAKRRLRFIHNKQREIRLRSFGAYFRNRHQEVHHITQLARSLGFTPEEIKSMVSPWGPLLRTHTPKSTKTEAQMSVWTKNLHRLRRLQKKTHPDEIPSLWVLPQWIEPTYDQSDIALMLLHDVC